MKKPWFAALLSCALFAGATASAWAGSSTIVKKDNQFFTSANYMAFASPWSVNYLKWLTWSKDYEDTITIDLGQFPNNTTIRTRWPTYAPPKGVWGYHHLAFGNYSGGAVQRAIAPRQVNAIRTLTEDFNFSYNGSSYFNLLNEFFLTSSPGNAHAKVIEIGLFLHAPATTMSYAKAGVQIGIFVDRWGRSWSVSKSGGFVMIVPRYAQDVLWGSFDFKQLLLFLKGKRVITGNEWFNGLAFGTEPTTGGGSTTLQVDHWKVFYN